MGSIRDASRAGTPAAAAAIISNKIAAAEMDQGSLRETPNNTLATSLVTPSAATAPIAIPAAAGASVSRITRPITSLRRAPRDMRIPISAVLRLTM